MAQNDDNERKDKDKRLFVGLRMTDEQSSLLSRIQKNAGLNKTQTLLRGLELLSEMYSLNLDHPPLSYELKRLEKEAVHHAESLKRIQSREESVREITRELRDIDSIVDKHGADPSALIQILLDVQAQYSWISRLALMWVSERLGIPTSRIYQIATFYKVFSLAPQGRHKVRVCLGTACHVRGGQKVMESAERSLGIKDGETTSDGLFTLNGVNCLGCCALGPVMTVDEEYYGSIKPDRVEKTLSIYKDKGKV
jgi:NADH-quinone oxidoreductase subunit E